MFLDDGWGTNMDLSSTSADATFVKDSLLKAGFVINEKKSIWLPVQNIEWIGIMWNSIRYEISIPDRRISDCLKNIQFVMENKNHLSARQLARCTGKLVSMQPVYGNLVRLMTRQLYLLIESRCSWDEPFKINHGHKCLGELEFWFSNLRCRNYRKLGSYEPTHLIAYSDASNFAAASFIVNCINSVHRSVWSEIEQIKSSTFREIRAVYFGLRAYARFLEGKSVKWLSDSQSCVHIIQAGSSKPELQREAMLIFQLCFDYNIDLRVDWIPRELNQTADSLSKMSSTDEWEVALEFFNHVDKMWGPHDVDRFASYNNRKTPRFNSLFAEFGSEALDCFTQSWSNCNNWLVPPISLVTKAVKHLLYCRGAGTLILPKWPSASFWPFLFDKLGHRKGFISDIMEFESGLNIFRYAGHSKKCVFNSLRFNSKVMAIRIVC